MALPCIVCDRLLEDAIPQGGGRNSNQPHAGTAFTTTGHYGSTVFDMEPGFLEINVCDPCLLSKYESVAHGQTKTPAPVVEYKKWDVSYLKKDVIPPGRTELVSKG